MTASAHLADLAIWTMWTAIAVWALLRTTLAVVSIAKSAVRQANAAERQALAAERANERPVHP